jgi:molybdopterin/thiamine biosynthesis adenylyltransferase
MKNQREALDLHDIDQRASVFASLNWSVDQIKSAKILVIGAGALGNEVLKNLALIGVENIAIIDFDVIERTNLAKSVLYREKDCTGDQLKVDIAAARIKEINPSSRIFKLNGDLTVDLGLGVLRRVDAIIGCVDNRLTRLWLNRFCHWLDKPWVDGGIEDLGGQVTVFYPGISCYESNLSPQAWHDIRFRNSCLTRAKRYSSAGIANTTPLTASIIGAMQVQEALKLLFNNQKSLLSGKQFFYEGLSNTYEVFPFNTLNKNALSRLRYEPIIECEQLSCKNSIGDALDLIRGELGTEEVSIQLHYQLVLSVKTEQSEQEVKLIKARPHIRSEDLEQFQVVEGEEVRIERYSATIDQDFPRLDLSLSSIGIPPLQILVVVANGKKHYLELTGDRDYLRFD